MEENFLSTGGIMTFDSPDTIDVTEEDIFVTYIEDQCIHARLTKFPEYLLWEIHEEISRSLPENHKPPSENLERGTLVAVNIEGMFARAVVLQVFQNQSVLVELLDVGTREIVHLFEIRLLSNAVSHYACMSVHVLLKQAAVVAAGESRTLRDIEVISAAGEVHLYGLLAPLPEKERKESCFVSAYNPNVELSCSRWPECPSQEQIAEQATAAEASLSYEEQRSQDECINSSLDSGAIPKSTWPSTNVVPDVSRMSIENVPVESPMPVLGEPEPSPEPERCCAPFQSVAPTAVSAVSAVGGPRLAMVRPMSLQQSRLRASLKPRIPEALTIGVHQIKVIAVPPHRQFVSIRCADTECRLRNLEKEIQGFASKYREVDSVQSGDYVLARFNDDQARWLRALVNEVDGDSIHVEFVDYAVFEHVPKNHLRELPACFSQQAAYAATLELNIKVEVGRHYNAVIDSKMDSLGRMFSGHVPEQFPIDIGTLETGIVFAKSEETLGTESRLVFGIQKNQSITSLEQELHKIYSCSLTPKTAFNVGDPAITVYEGIFCRAIIVGVETSGVTVIHVDYGSRDRVLFGEVFELAAGPTSNHQMLSFQCVFTYNEEPQIGDYHGFEIHQEISSFGGLPVYEATLLSPERL